MLSGSLVEKTEVYFMIKSIEKEKEKIKKEKQKIEARERLLREKEKKQKTKKLISLGNLLAKFSLDELDDSVLFGALSEIRDMSKDQSNIQRWSKKGKEEFSRFDRVEMQPLIISFDEMPDKEITKEIKKYKFKFNQFRSEWYGHGVKSEIEDFLKGHNAKVETVP